MGKSSGGNSIANLTYSGGQSNPAEQQGYMGVHSGIGNEGGAGEPGTGANVEYGEPMTGDVADYIGANLPGKVGGFVAGSAATSMFGPAVGIPVGYAVEKGISGALNRDVEVTYERGKGQTLGGSLLDDDDESDMAGVDSDLESAMEDSDIF